MSIAENLERVHGQIEQACRHANRSAGDVALMAVSKVHPVEALLEAYAAGQRLFGENRVQEFAEKAPALARCPDAEVHLIGPLQSNKTTRAAELFQSIDTVDSLKIATRLSTAAGVFHAATGAIGKRLPVYIEVKLSHEESKHGLAPTALAELLNQIQPLEHIVAVGLMTVPPWSEDPETARPYFRALRKLRDEQVARHPELTRLSMGMSNDFAVAIEEGSTSVRIGTAIFGSRTITR